MAAVNAWPFISTQYGEMVVACLFYTPFNRGGESFLCAFPAFVLTTTKKKNNRWIKSFNYPCEERADTECVCVCVWYNSPHTVRGQRSGCHGSSDWGLEKVGRRGREQTVGKGRREIQKQMDEGEKKKKIGPSNVPHARMRVVSVTRWAYSKFVLPNAGSKGQAWTSNPKALAHTETCSRFSEKAHLLIAQ